MRAHSLRLLAALALPVASVSCPWSEDAAVLRPEPEPEPVALVPSPLAAGVAPPLLPATTALPSTAPSVDPGLLTTLPPELVDDGSDDVKDPEPAAPPPPSLPAREVDELASTAKETWVFAE